MSPALLSAEHAAKATSTTAHCTDIEGSSATWQLGPFLARFAAKTSSGRTTC